MWYKYVYKYICVYKSINVFIHIIKCILTYVYVKLDCIESKPSSVIYML